MIASRHLPTHFWGDRQSYRIWLLNWRLPLKLPRRDLKPLKVKGFPSPFPSFSIPHQLSFKFLSTGALGNYSCSMLRLVIALEEAVTVLEGEHAKCEQVKAKVCKLTNMSESNTATAGLLGSKTLHELIVLKHTCTISSPKGIPSHIYKYVPCSES